MEHPQYFTLPQIAAKVGKTCRQVEYAISQHKIREAFRVGITRVFDIKGAEAVAAAANDISSRRREVANV